MTSFVTLWLAGVGLALLPFAAALPCLGCLDPDLARALVRKPKSWGILLACLLGGGLLFALFLVNVRDRDSLDLWGRTYASGLQLLLLAAGFILAIGGLLLVWPRAGAVALAACRESIRQPLFWLLAGFTALLMLVSLAVPYFTFGDDFKMMKQLDFDLIMLASTLFVVVTASLSIAEEIEGRTAITLMSKPLSRRQFLLGKYVGILLAGLLLTGLLGWWLNWCIYWKSFDTLDDTTDLLKAQIEPSLRSLAQALTPEGEARHFAGGMAGWFADTLAALPGLALGFCQVALFLAIAAALATRLPLVVNLAACLVIYFLGNLAPFLLQYSQNLSGHAQRNNPGGSSTTIELVQFTARVADTVLPALEYFGLSTAIIRDRPLPFWDYLGHVGLVAGYSLTYTAIALLFGLILFEDRDLA